MTVVAASLIIVIAVIIVSAHLLTFVLDNSRYFKLWSVILAAVLLLVVYWLLTLKPIYIEATPIKEEVVVYDYGRFAVVEGKKYRVVYSHVDKPQFIYTKYGFPMEVYKLELHLPMPKYNAE